jgi:uncharacterized protein YgfB (UPF0149 family)
MSPEPLPDFHHALMLSHGDLESAELSECHGVLCGMICGDHGQSADQYLGHLQTLQLLDDASGNFREVMSDAFDSTSQQLSDEDLRFNLWLPDDEQPLEERTLSLAHWCTGLLAGLGLGGPMQDLSDEATEALNDLQEIARAGFSSESDNDDELSEEEANEQAFFEIVEYVRVVTLILRAEMRGPGAQDQIH